MFIVKSGVYVSFQEENLESVEISELGPFLSLSNFLGKRQFSPFFLEL
jgi:hypothetical protein